MDPSELIDRTREAFATILQTFVEGRRSVEGQRGGREEISHCMNKGRSQTYNYIHEGKAEFAEVRALVRLCGDDELRLAIGELLFEGTGFKVVNEDGEGGASVKALINNAMDGVQAAATFARTAHEIVEDGVVSPPDLVKLRSAGDGVCKAVEAAVNSAELVSEKTFHRLPVRGLVG